ncbi:MAG: MBL fold metallo-hydrolase [Methylacidiphilales bacterium]|nr:MBL fold metallo-hydrolase [Candidatus Methylacidiphilales bacterium]
MSLIFRQLFDASSSTFTYIVGDSSDGSACIIDPVRDNAELYIRYVSQLQCRLLLSVETHVHADHISAGDTLRESTGCATRIGKESKVNCSSGFFSDGEKLQIGAITLVCWYTPGHTEDSYCFYNESTKQLFTGDTLLIRGSGRTDFQNGSAVHAYKSLQRLLQCSDDTIVYPGHDYHGLTMSTIGEERMYNPRLQFPNEQEFVSHMNSLNFPKPERMDIAVPANQACGKIVNNNYIG